MSQLRKKSHSEDYTKPWDSDVFERKKIADYLTTAIVGIRQPFVISLSSGYGTGKTFFIKNWESSLKDQGHKCVYFNAWEEDYMNDPFVAFMSSLKQQLSESEPEIQTKLLNTIKEGGAYVSRKAIPIIAKGVVSKLIGHDTVDELFALPQGTEDDIANLLGEIATERLKYHEEISQSVVSFKKYLSEFVDALTNEGSEGKKKFIVFVDELDRCRPTYAAEVLECIKHLFNIDGIVFIIAVDETQLRNAINSVYGVKIDGEEYLRKFIDWQLRLPAPSAVDYASYLFEDFGLGEIDRFKGTDFFEETQRSSADPKGLIQTFGLFAEAFSVTLREQAQCFTEINLIIRTLPDNKYLRHYLIAIISVLRLKYHDKLLACIKGELDPSEFTNEIGNKLDQERYREVTWHNWHDHHRYVFEAFFTNEKFRASLIKKQKSLQEQLSQTKADPNRRIESSLEHIKEVLDMHNIIKRRARTDETDSMAKQVYNLFEFSSQLT